MMQSVQLGGSKARAAIVKSILETPPSHLIDGALETSEQFFEVIDPATGRVCANCPSASADQLDRAVAAAQRAQPAWAALSVPQRRDYLAKLADVMLKHQSELAALITLEQGKPLARAVTEVARAAAQVNRVAAIPLEPKVLRDNAQGRIELHQKPLGVVGAITPWNMPIVLALPKITHALYTGNTIVLKPSPYTPLAILRLAQYTAGVLPAGVLNILAGGDDFGGWMSTHPGIDKISFTGSTGTGKKVVASSANRLKRLTLELGGNDAAIVLPDVDVPSIVPKLFAAAFVNSGQVCMAIKRLYVHESLHDQVAEGLAELAKNTRVGDGFEPEIELGPVQNKMQHEIVQRLLNEAKSRGGNFLAGGYALEQPGYFIAPSIVTGLPEDSALVQEEPFGPVLPVLSFKDVDDVVQRANATRYGLGGSVWSNNVSMAADVAARLEVGVAWVNQHMGLDACAPFGGAKESGGGCEYGEEGLQQYTQSLALYVPRIKD